MKSLKKTDYGYISDETLLARIRAEITHYNNTGLGLQHVNAAIESYSDRMAERSTHSY